MNFRQLFKADRKKIILTFILFLLSLYKLESFPFVASYMTGGGCYKINGSMICVGTTPHINWYFLILNIIVRLITAFIFSSFIVWVYGKVKKKSQ